MRIIGNIITKIGIVAVFLVFFGVFIFSGRAFGSTKTLMMSPMNQRIVLIPGETYHGGFKIANSANAEEDLKYIVSVSTFFVQQDEEGGDYKVDNSTRSDMNMIVDWTTIDEASGVVRPNGEKVVSFTIEVPEDAPAGGQYMEILAREDKDGQVAENGVNEIIQMGHIIYAEVAGSTRKEGVILENSVPSFIMSDNLEAVSRIKNGGNVHTDAEAVLQVWPLFSDEEICTNEENASSIFVMPGTERYHTETCQLPSVGIFRAKQTVKIFGETSIVEKTIIVCPIWLLFIIIFVIFALVFYFVARARARKKAAKK